MPRFLDLHHRTNRRTHRRTPCRLALAALGGLLCGFGAPANAAAPIVFAPGVISGAAHEASPAFLPDGRTVYFTRTNGSDYDILVSHLDGGRWSAPEIAPFSGRWRDLEAAMAPDGSYLIFASSRPLPGTTAPPDGAWSGTTYPGRGGNLWRVDRTPAGWSEPRRLEGTINRSTSVFSPAITADGTLYFMEAAGEGLRFRLFRAARKGGGYAAPEPLPFTAGEWGGVDPAVAPDDSFLVFSSVRPPAQPKQNALFIVFRKDGQWGTPRILPDEINRLGSITEARLGPDGHTLYFSVGAVVPTTFPKDLATARDNLATLMSWNTGDDNIWSVDIADLLRDR